jgi:hypothetical protein
MKSYRNKNVELFNGIVDKTYIVEQVPTTEEPIIIDDIYPWHGPFWLVESLKTASVFSFRTKFIHDVKEQEDNSHKEKIPKEVNSVIFAFYKLLGLDYVKDNYYNLFEKLKIIRYVVTHPDIFPSNATFKEIFINNEFSGYKTKILEENDNIKLKQFYFRIYYFYRSIIEDNVDLLLIRFNGYIDTYKESVANLLNYENVVNLFSHLDKWSNQETFSFQSKLLGDNDNIIEAIVILYELFNRFFINIDIDINENIVVSGEYLENYFKIEHVAICNGLIYIFLKDRQTVLLYTNIYKINNTDEEYRLKGLPSLIPLSVDRGIYLIKLSIPIYSVEHDEHNVFLQLDNGDILATGSNINDKLNLGNIFENTPELVYNFHSFAKTYSYSIGLNNTKIKEYLTLKIINRTNHVYLLQDNNYIKVSGNIDDTNPLFTLVPDDTETAIDKGENNIIITDFYVSDNESSYIAVMSNNRIYGSGSNENNKFLFKVTESIPYYGEWTELTSFYINDDLLSTNIRQLVLNDNNIVYIVNNDLCISGRINDEVYSINEIPYKTSSIDLTLSINKFFMLDGNNGVIVEFLEKDLTKIDELAIPHCFKYFALGTNTSGRLGINMTDQVVLPSGLIPIVIQNSPNTQITNFYRIERLISTINKTIVLFDETNIFVSGLNEGHFFNLKSSNEDDSNLLDNNEIHEYSLSFISAFSGYTNSIIDIDIIANDINLNSSLVYTKNIVYYYSPYYFIGNIYDRKNENKTSYPVIKDPLDVNKKFIELSTNPPSFYKISDVSLLAGYNSIYRSNSLFSVLFRLLDNNPLETTAEIFTLKQFQSSYKVILNIILEEEKAYSGAVNKEFKEKIDHLRLLISNLVDSSSYHQSLSLTLNNDKNIFDKEYFSNFLTHTMSILFLSNILHSPHSSLLIFLNLSGIFYEAIKALNNSIDTTDKINSGRKLKDII